MRNAERPTDPADSEPDPDVSPDEGLYRVGPLADISDILTSLGHDLRDVLGPTGVDPALLQNPENLMGFRAMGRVFEAARAATGLDHFGLLTGQRAKASHPALIRQLMANAPNIGVAMSDLCANQPRFVHGAVTYLMMQEDVAFWGYMIHVPGVRAADQIYDGAAAIGMAVLRRHSTLCPLQILLRRSAPADPRPYVECFGLLPQFGAAQNAMVLPREGLATPIPGADPAERARLQKLVDEYWAVRQPSFAARLERMLHARVMFGAVALEDVAEALHMHPRTVRRRLRDEGLTFRDLLAQVRLSGARDLIRGTSIPITEIALSQGYNDLSAFTRAFRGWTGQVPSEIRATASGAGII